MKLIKTTVPRKKNATVPHRSYMKISCLEMERVRLTTEKNKATVRINAINARLKQIDTEKERLLENLKENPASVLPFSEEVNQMLDELPIQKNNDFGLKLKY
jgi:predicted nuclease with TOPRIM domain